MIGVLVAVAKPLEEMLRGRPGAADVELEGSPLDVGRRRGEVPSDPELLRKLPGVGDYLADAYSAVVFSTPVVAADVNVARVISRLLGLEPAPFRDAIASLRRATRHMASQPRNAERVVDLNWALLDFGATMCTARRPSCEACFAGGYCAGRR